jgi:hypothetical protein
MVEKGIGSVIYLILMIIRAKNDVSMAFFDKQTIPQYSTRIFSSFQYFWTIIAIPVVGERA